MQIKKWIKFRRGPLQMPWQLFPAIFVLLYAAHLPFLRLPYYWDEAGYYIPAAWDFFRTGSLIPISTLSNAHPPLPSFYLAACWKIAGFSVEVTREATLVAAALGLTAVWRISMRLVYSVPVALWTVLLTALYPVWFAQSALAHADIFAAACTLWGLSYALPGRRINVRRGALWFALAALAKETAIFVPLTLAALSFWNGMRLRGGGRKRLWREAAWQAGCVLPLAGWFLYHYLKTGFLFGNPEFLRYNAEATLTPVRILAALFHRVLHLTSSMNLFVPVGMGLASLLLTPRPDKNGHDRNELDWPARRAILLLLGVNAVAFSLLGGALLMRYLLPMFPLVLLMAVTELYRRVRYWQALTAVAAAAFGIALFVNPPYRFSPEDNLAYARVVRLHQNAIEELNRVAPGARVLTAWPASDELTRPELGYLQQPYSVEVLPDFTAPSIARAAQEPEKFTAALVFSTKFDPPSVALNMGAKSDAMDEQYFGMHHDLQPEAIAKKLGGELVWQQEDQGWWAGVIRFRR